MSSSTYRISPGAPTGPFALNHYGWKFYLIKPEKRTNILTSGSMEYLNATSYPYGWDAQGSAEFNWNPTDPWRGGMALEICKGTSANLSGQGARAGYSGSTNSDDLVLSSNTQYIISFWAKARRGEIIRGGVTVDNTDNYLTYRNFVGTGFWQWYWFPYKEVAGATRNLVFSIVSQLPKAAARTYTAFYLDCVQIEVISSGPAYPTTYIDGDEQGLIANQDPVAYYWHGARGRSAATRSGQTRAGGKVVSLESLGLNLVSLVGLGLVQPQTIVQPFSQLDGADFQDIIFGERQFALAMQNAGRSVLAGREARKQLYEHLIRDNVGVRQPLKLLYCPVDEAGVQVGTWGEIVATYEGGLEGNQVSPTGDIITANFKQQLPYIRGKSNSVFTTGATTANGDYGVYKTEAGVWAQFHSANAAIRQLMRGLDGKVYICGDFSNLGGVTGASFFCRYDPATDTIERVAPATTFGASVNCMAQDAKYIYIGGSFTNVGDANGDRILRYDPTTDTIASMSTGMGGVEVFSIEYVQKYNSLIITGDFNLATCFGVANCSGVVKWDITAGTGAALGTGLTGGVCRSSETLGDKVYFAGEFTTAGGVAARIAVYDLSALTWSTLTNTVSGGSGAIFDIERGLDGVLYFGGNFVGVGGVTSPGCIAYNGVSFQALGLGLDANGPVLQLSLDNEGNIVAVGGFTEANNQPLPSNIARWTGTDWLATDLLMTSAATVAAAHTLPDGRMIVGLESTATINVGSVATVTYRGTEASYPQLRIRSSAAGAKYFSAFTNNTTRQQVLFDYDLAIEELLTINLDPLNFYAVSNIEGDISDKFLPGSNLANMVLVRGDNLMTVVGDPSLYVNIVWEDRLQSIDDLVLEGGL